KIRIVLRRLEGARKEQIVVPGEIPRAFYPVIKVGGGRVKKANPPPPAIGQDRIISKYPDKAEKQLQKINASEKYNYSRTKFKKDTKFKDREPRTRSKDPAKVGLQKREGKNVAIQVIKKNDWDGFFEDYHSFFSTLS
ncbi:hypothetical protein TRV_04580, partial [Trichophyton verrucosum HKI 0517]